MTKGKYNYSIYTPRHIARELVKNLLDAYFGEDPTIEKLNRLRVGDLSCGSGNLLLMMLEELIRLAKKLTGEYFYKENWITGYDINKEAIDIAMVKGQAILKKYHLSGKLNFFCKNSLNDMTRFNMMIGNPPYLGEKNNKELFQDMRKTPFGTKYYEAKMDYFYFFIEKAVDLLEKNGILSYITTNYWLKANGAKKLRSALKEKGNFLIINDLEASAFKKAIGQHNVIFCWKKSKDTDDEAKITLPDDTFTIKNSMLYDKEERIVLANKDARSFNQKIEKYANRCLDDLVNINQGLVSGMDDAFIMDQYNEKYKKFLKPFYKNKDIGRYTISDKNQYWLLYLDGTKRITKPVEKYLLKYQDKLADRREVSRGSIYWWQLQWAREEKIFKGPKILARQRCRYNHFAYTEKDVYGSADVYFITKKSRKINLFYVLGYLNSEVFRDWFRYNGKLKGQNFEFYSTPLKETPIYYPRKKEDLQHIEDLVKQQIEHFSNKVQKEIDSYFRTKLKI